LRWLSGFKLIDILPLFVVVFVPSAPINDERLSTAGSARTAFVSSSCFSAIAFEPIVGGACDMPWMTPVSCTGKNPLGMMM
jgi:hypothetical protein